MGWGVVEVEPITCLIIKPLRVTYTFAYYCYAMLVDVDWVSDIHNRCEIFLNQWFI